MNFIEYNRIYACAGRLPYTHASNDAIGTHIHTHTRSHLRIIDPEWMRFHQGGAVLMRFAVCARSAKTSVAVAGSGESRGT